MSALRRRAPLPAIVVASVFWLLVGVGCGVLLDRQIQPSEASSRQPGPDYSLISQAWRLIDRNYVDRDKLDSTPMTYAAISGMVDALGDTGHSTFLTPRMVRENKEALDGHFAGIGAEVRMQEKQVVIVAPMDGSPAQRAGLKPGEFIVKVNDKATAGESLQHVVDRIRGPANTAVKLSLREPHGDRIREVTLVRAEIDVPSVTWALIPGTRIADVRISSFSKDTAEHLARALRSARAGHAQALVLDLRNDPGGLLSQAIDVASQFLRDGYVLLEKDAQGNVRPVAVRNDRDEFALPMVVLTNSGTASAAEIVAGALRDHGRAKLVGQKTFGTGTVLREFPLRDGSALMLAVEEWLTPKGQTIWHKGIAPDVRVVLSADVMPVLPDTLKHMSVAALAKSKDTQLHEALRLLQGAHGSPRSVGQQADVD